MRCTPEQFDEISKNSIYHDIGTLPSNGAAYIDKNPIYVRPFKLPELRLLSKAAQLNELGPMIRAVDNCISRDVNTLTIGDFYYVLLWMRMHSMPKSPYIIEWFCDQPFFRHKESRQVLLYSMEDWPDAETLSNEYDVSSCNTNNTSTVHHSDLSIITLPDDFAPLPEGFDFPRVAILEEFSAALKDAEMSMLAPAIQWIAGATWADRVKALDENPDLLGEALELNRTIVHGMEETVTYACQKCRVQHSHKLVINAMSFFQ